MSAPAPDLTDHGERLDRARTRMRDALLGAVQLLAPLGAQPLRVALDELQAAWGDYEDALTDRVTALVINRDLADRQTQDHSGERIAALERWAYGTGEQTERR
jgi:hypothetical protein